MDTEKTSSSDETEKFPWSSQSLHEDIWIRSPGYLRETEPKPHSYASFGDGEGTTVSVNAYGHILQISRYFGFGSSGLFCVDQEDTSQPYYAVSRMEQLMYLSQSPDLGLRLRFQGLQVLDQRPPIVGFMYDQWPRYVFDSVSETLQDSKNLQPDASKEIASTIRSFDLSIQYYCELGTIFQQYHIKSAQMSSVLSNELVIHKNIRIENLDFVNYQGSEEQDNNEKWSRSVRVEILDSVLRQDAGKKREPDGNNKNEKASYTEESNKAEEQVESEGVNNSRKNTDTRRKNDDDKKADRNGEHISTGVKNGFIFTRLMKANEKLVYPEQIRSNDPKYIALIMKAFVGNVVQNISENGKIELDESTKERARKDGKLEITMAYRLQLLSETQNDKLFSGAVTPAASTMTPDCMQRTFSTNNRFKKFPFAEDSKIDFIIRRNLEHILSVCCIPIRNLPTFGEIEADSSDSRSSPDIHSATLIATAITCGDISGHLVGSKATLSSVQFLCSMLTFIEHNQPEPRTEYLEKLMGRIRKVLDGHLLWICTKAGTHDNGRLWSHHWPSGLPISDLTWLPPPSLIDTPIQLLKIFWILGIDSKAATSHDVSALDMEITVGTTGMKELSSKIKRWILELHATNKQGNYAFPKEYHWFELEYGVTAKYSLTDHVMICLALQCASIFISERTFKDSSLRDHYAHDQVRERILKRFTVQSPMTKRKTLATSRTSEWTRLLMHSKDTFLFHAMEVGFFRKSSQGKEKNTEKHTKEPTRAHLYDDDRWKSTLNNQGYFDEYEDLEWTKPLWYGLIFILGIQHKRINSSSIEELLTRARDIIFDVSGHSGLLPGLLDNERQPRVFENEIDRDDYWHATFKIPHVLWTYGRKVIFPKSTPEKPNSKQKVILAVSETQESSKLGQNTEKRIPFVIFGTLLDQKRLVEVSDHWLQAGSLPLTLPVQYLCEEEKWVNELSTDFERNSLRSMITSSTRSRLDNVIKIQGSVIDVPRNSQGNEIFEGRQYLESEALHQSILDPRTIWTSKKRIIWLQDEISKFASNCHEAVPNVERGKVKGYFNRHIAHDIYFYDEATSSMNVWETELHFSFYRQTSTAPRTLNDKLSRRYESSYLNAGFVMIKPIDAGASSTFLSPVTISFRFSGDFFDRVWTCYFLTSREGTVLNPAGNASMTLGEHLKSHKALKEYIEDHQTRSKTNGSVSGSLEKTVQEKKWPGRSWQQRKILELLLFHTMLDELYGDTQNIFECIEREFFQPRNPLRAGLNNQLRGFTATKFGGRIMDSISETGKSDGANSLAKAVYYQSQLHEQVTGDNYYAIIREWRQSEQILAAIEENLNENLERIYQRNRREED